MKRGTGWILWAAAGVLSAAGARAADDPGADSALWVRGANASALNLFRRVAGEQGNAVLSPWSLGSAMSMALAGAGGETAGEMAGALAMVPLLGRLDEAHSAAQRAVAGLSDGEGVAFHSAQGLALGARSDRLAAAYVERMREGYGAEVFRSPEPGPINDWVSARTRGRIPTLLDSLPPDTVCVLLNAVYFKGLWEDPFEPDETRPEPFRRPGREPVEVPMMRRAGRYPMLEDGSARVLGIPYAGGRALLIVALPGAPDGLDDLVAGLAADRVERWLEGLKRPARGEVELRLPRFHIEARYDLLEAYGAMGIRRAFSSLEAQFPHMTGSDRPGEVWISRIVHRAMIEVNEEGTEAAAATGVVMVTRALPEPPRRFFADRPFLFLLADRATGAVLFLGRMDDPAADR